MRIPRDLRWLILDKELSDGALRTFEVMEVLGERPQEEIAQARGVSAREVRRHQKELKADKNVLPYIVYKQHDTFLVRRAEREARRRADAWLTQERERLKVVSAGRTRVAFHGSHCQGLGCFGILATEAKLEPLEECHASEVEVMNWGRWESLGYVQ